MKKVFHFDSPADLYAADAAVLCCFDHRIGIAGWILTLPHTPLEQYLDRLPS